MRCCVYDVFLFYSNVKRGITLDCGIVRRSNVVRSKVYGGVMDRRYCTSCSATKPAEGGRMKRGNKINRWQCKWCAEGSTPSIYSSKSKEVLIDNGDRVVEAREET
jgi:hypothetical protein